MNFSIRNKILFLVSGILTIAIITIMVYSFVYLTQIISREKHEDFQERIRLIMDTLQHKLDDYNNYGAGDMTMEALQSDIIDEFNERYYMKVIETNNNDDIKIYPFIIDGNGITIMHPGEPIGRNTLQNLPFIKKMLSMQEKKDNFNYIYENEKKWLLFNYYEPWDWYIAYAIKSSDKYASRSKFLKGLFLNLIIVLLIMITVLYFVIRKFIKPLQKVVMNIKEIASGQGDLTQRLDYNSRDEIGELSIYFNQFVNFLSGIIESVKNAIDNTKAVSDNLATSAQDTAAGLEQIKVNIQFMKKKAVLLDEEVKASNNSSNDVLAYIQGVVSEISDQAAAITESSAAIEEMSSSIQNIAKIAEDKLQTASSLQQQSEEGKQQMDSTIEINNSINDTANIIVNIIKVIAKIANQTNLLSMNAAIEAAHAGEAGRGFSVVAQEIRTLAEDTGNNAKQISNSVKNVTDNINKSVGSIKATGKTIDQMVIGIKDFADSLLEMKNATQELSIGSNQIIDALSSIMSKTDIVKASGDNMQNKITAINDAMDKVANISTANKSGMNEIETGINKIVTYMGTLSELSSENLTKMSELEKIIGNFKITK